MDVEDGDGEGALVVDAGCMEVEHEKRNRDEQDEHKGDGEEVELPAGHETKHE